jgi:ABC-2 type transport system ATP-binding protein
MTLGMGIDEFNPSNSEIPASNSITKPAIEVEGLVKRYGKDFTALNGVDLSIESGKVFALLGPNGAGKTTLMRILTTQLRANAGVARIFGLDVEREGDRIRRLISYVPQEMSVWTDITGRENMIIYSKLYKVPSEGRRQLIDELLSDMGLMDFADRMVGKYSGGMIRRLEMACALLVKPSILFLDEPTIGLDPSARRTVWDKITHFKKVYGSTIFFNTHYMDEADLYSDEIAIINQGKVVIKGTTGELKHSIGESVRLTLADQKVPEPTLSQLRALPSVKGLELNNSALTLFVEDAEAALPPALKVVEASGIGVLRASIVSQTLDEVFFKYAGARIDGMGRAVEARQVRSMIKRGG